MVFQRMVHLAVAVLTKSCGSRSVQLAGPIAMVMLAVTGGLAVCASSKCTVLLSVVRRAVHTLRCTGSAKYDDRRHATARGTRVLIALSASWLAPKIMHIAHPLPIPLPSLSPAE